MPDDLAPEDRDKLVDIKFGELFRRHADRYITELDQFQKANRQQHSSTAPAPQQQQQQQQTQTPRRRSLLEECFSQAFHFG